jgi:hypothetical protein
MVDLRFDPDGFVDLDHIDDSPLGFTERRAADRLLRSGATEGLSPSWKTRLLGDESLSTGPLLDDHDHDSGDDTEVDSVVTDLETFHRSARFQAVRQRFPLAVAAAVVLVLILVATQLTRESSDTPDFRSPTTTAAPTTTTAPTTTASTTTVAPPPQTSQPEVPPVLPTEITDDDPAPTVTTPNTTGPAPSPTNTTSPPTSSPAPGTIFIGGVPESLTSGVSVRNATASGSGWDSVAWTTSGPCEVTLSSITEASVWYSGEGPCTLTATGSRLDGALVPGATTSFVTMVNVLPFQIAMFCGTNGVLAPGETTSCDLLNTNDTLGSVTWRSTGGCSVLEVSLVLADVTAPAAGFGSCLVTATAVSPGGTATSDITANIDEAT